MSQYQPQNEFRRPGPPPGDPPSAPWQPYRPDPGEAYERARQAYVSPQPRRRAGFTVLAVATAAVVVAVGAWAAVWKLSPSASSPAPASSAVPETAGTVIASAAGCRAAYPEWFRESAAAGHQTATPDQCKGLPKSTLDKIATDYLLGQRS